MRKRKIPVTPGGGFNTTALNLRLRPVTPCRGVSTSKNCESAFKYGEIQATSTHHAVNLGWPGGDGNIMIFVFVVSNLRLAVSAGRSEYYFSFE